jgi:hypothetical protein
MSTSETVQAAQRLLAERERVGLAKYGTTVDRTDLQAGDWLQHAIEEASDLLLYLIRLQQTMPRSCPAGPAPQFIVSPIVCPGTPDAHTLTLKIGVQSFRIGGGLDYDTREEAEWTANQLLRALANMQQPALCECRERPASQYPGPDPAKTHALAQWLLATESGKPIPSFDEWRAAYLARWANAPAIATHLAQDPDGPCFFHFSEPYQDYASHPWVSSAWSYAGHNLLGSVRCEPRPRAEGER